jgi:hypothetical protein
MSDSGISGSDRRQFAATRSHQDTLSTDNLFTANSNAVLYLNGGAAVALLAFYAEVFTDLMDEYFKILFITGELAYCLGALCVIFAVRGFRRGVKELSEYWQAIALDEQGLLEAPRRAGERISRANSLLTSSVVAFVLGTLAVGSAIIFFSPVTNQAPALAPSP